MKKILVPTDFSIGSLNVIHSIAARFEEPVEVVLFHAVYLSNNISDLLFMTKKISQTYITKDYTEACEILRNKYSSRIQSLKTTFFYGSSSMAFNNFVEANDPDYIAINGQHTYKETYKHSIDPMPLVRRAKVELLSLNVETVAPARKISEQETLSELLLSTY